MIMMGRGSVARALAAGVVLAASLASCTDAAPPPPTDPAGRELTLEEATAALPEPHDLSDQLVLQPTDEGDPEGSTYPASCADVLFGGEAMKALDRDHQATKAERDYAAERAGYLVIRVKSYDRPVPTAPFDAAGAAVAKCPTFTQTYDDEATKWSMSALGLSSRGDQMFAARMTLAEDAPPMLTGQIVDIVQIRKGHTLISIVYSVGRNSRAIPGLVDRAAEQTLAGLPR